MVVLDYNPASCTQNAVALTFIADGGTPVDTAVSLLSGSKQVSLPAPIYNR